MLYDIFTVSLFAFIESLKAIKDTTKLFFRQKQFDDYRVNSSLEKKNAYHRRMQKLERYKN